MYDNYGLLIDNKWRSASNGQVKSVYSPSTEQEIGRVPLAEKIDLDAVLKSAENGFNTWKKISAWDRSVILYKAGRLLQDRKADYAKLMTSETGKPLVEAEAEINASGEQFIWYSEEAKRVYGQSIPARAEDLRMNVIYQPIGICLSLSAWNFPTLLPTRKIAAALAAGCSIIVRPASEAPGSSFIIAQVLIEVGLPPGVINIVTGDAAMISDYLIKSPKVRKISLTGSTEVGKTVLTLAAQGIKRVSMELGGHAPVIVHQDADPILAARALAPSKFRNCGQVCISPSRFFVHQDLVDDFSREFAGYAKSLKIGDGHDTSVNIGPMIKRTALEKSLALIADAKEKGAEVLAGGNQLEGRGYFLQPTVLSNVSDDALIMKEEPFAPIAPIRAFTDYNQAIKEANSTPYGLAGYLFTNQLTLAQKTAEELEVGMVGINEVLLACAEAPFGGIKQSGYGREGGSQGIYEYLEIKYIKTKLLS